MLVCMGVGRIFSGGPLVGFSKSFSRGAKSGEVCFLPFETKKQPFLPKFSNFCPPSDTYGCVKEKLRTTPLNN